MILQSKRNPILLVLFTLLALFAHGQEIRLRSALEHDSIWLGDQIKLMLVVEQPKGVKVIFPHLADSIQKVELLKKSIIDTSKIDGGKLQLKQTILITCFDSGAHRIPPFYFRMADRTDSLQSNELTLFVKLPRVDLKKGPVDIKKPFGAPITLKEIAPWILGLILIGAIIFLIIYAISRRNRNKPLFQRPAKPKVPPHITAIEELDKLKSEGLWQLDQVKNYYTRLSDILRVYIEERFELPAMEQTTHEILVGFKVNEVELDPSAIKELGEILELSDLVKFAKLNPLPDQNLAMIHLAYAFVNKTTPVGTSEPAKGLEGSKSISTVNPIQTPEEERES